MRFSLRTLILGVVLVGLVVTAGFLAWENRGLRNENSELRLREGILKVEDPSKINAISTGRLEDNFYRWKVFTPKGRDSKLVVVRKTPEDGEVRRILCTLPDGEIFEVGIKFRKEGDGVWRVVGTCGEHGFFTVDEIDWLGNGDFPSFSMGSGGNTVSPNSRMRLMGVWPSFTEEARMWGKIEVSIAVELEDRR